MAMDDGWVEGMQCVEYLCKAKGQLILVPECYPSQEFRAILAVKQFKERNKLGLEDMYTVLGNVVPQGGHYAFSHFELL